MNEFKLISSMKPKGDQPQAIQTIVEGIKKNKKFQTLIGVTGSGKTFTIANVIEKVQKPTLVISHNKTLAAQLYAEFKEFFPNNEVHYFVSYYDYYQPEAYIPQRDIYIEKDASINENLDRLRLATTSALISHRDVIVVASVSAIYNIGSPEDYQSLMFCIHKGIKISMDTVKRKLVDLQYERSVTSLERGKFRVKGDLIEILPSYEKDALKFDFWNDEITSIYRIHPISGEILEVIDNVIIYPAKHFVMPENRIERVIKSIKLELKERLKELKKQNKLVEAHRLEARTMYDIEMLKEVGYCKGIENYSRHLSNRKHGERPYTLLDYFPEDYLLIIDESHVTIPQIRGMYNGDRSRKQTLVDYGFRLPSALDNRPLKFDEFESLINQVIFVSATPGEYELKSSNYEVVEQIIRPTGLVDPEIEVRPAKNQVPDLLKEIHERIKQNERILVTTLTKRLAEDLSHYLQDEDIKGKYLHSEIDTIERVKILRELREGKIDVIVGVNLLREGLDLPEVSLVAILDADKEGFLRSETSIIQTVGRTARNVNGKVILYADVITASMHRAIKETQRRRKIQLAYNKKHKITPRTIQKEIRQGIEVVLEAEKIVEESAGFASNEVVSLDYIKELEEEMFKAADELQFEKAAELRDRIEGLRAKLYNDKNIKFKTSFSKSRRRKRKNIF